jgi:SET domain-containing protein
MVTGLEVRKTRSKGLGVFATKYFFKGDLIECAHVIVIPTSEILLNNPQSIMRHYVFMWDEKLALATGYGCFYNHSYKPNAIHYKHLDLEEVHYHALSDIPENEEVTINYGGYPTYSEPLWFEAKEL